MNADGRRCFAEGHLRGWRRCGGCWRLAPGVIFVRGEFAFLTEPLASEATDYAYGVDHALLSGRYSDARIEVNRAQVFGSGVFGERFDWAGVQAVYDDLRQEHDRNLMTVVLVESSAEDPPGVGASLRCP